MNRRRKVTAEQQKELLEHYLGHGAQASATKCEALGLSPKYASSIAAASGYRRPLWRAGCRYKDSNVDQPNASSRTKSNRDHRWKLAIERGSVVA